RSRPVATDDRRDRYRPGPPRAHRDLAPALGRALRAPGPWPRGTCRVPSSAWQGRAWRSLRDTLSRQALRGQGSLLQGTWRRPAGPDDPALAADPQRP